MTPAEWDAVKAEHVRSGVDLAVLVAQHPSTRTNLKRRLWIVLAVLVAFAAGLAAGQFAAPEKVQLVDKLVAVERWHTLELRTEDITRGMTFAKQVDRVVYRNVVTTITDAGTTITDNSIEREGSSETAAEHEEIKRVSVVEVEREKIVEHVVEKTVTLRPRFRVSLLAGLSWPAPLIPIYGPLTFGAQFDFRVFGGFSLGVWLQTFGAAGLAASLELP